MGPKHKWKQTPRQTVSAHKGQGGRGEGDSAHQPASARARVAWVGGAALPHGTRYLLQVEDVALQVTFQLHFCQSVHGGVPQAGWLVLHKRHPHDLACRRVYYETRSHPAQEDSMEVEVEVEQGRGAGGDDSSMLPQKQTAYTWAPSRKRTHTAYTRREGRDGQKKGNNQKKKP